MEYRELPRLLSKWSGLGQDRGHRVSYIGLRGEGRPSGWMHTLFDPVDPDLYGEFLKTNSFFRKFEYSEFLRFFNGARLFRRSLVLAGAHLLPVGERQYRDPAVPSDIVSLNRSFADCAQKYDGTVIGLSLFSGKGLLYVEQHNSRVISVARPDLEKIEEWSGLRGFLESEVVRLNEAFDQNGDMISSAPSR
jgi:hypothetical protein